jgi:cytochrome bd-type quinol oxidase subunit 2
LLIIGRLIVSRQGPEYVGAAQKKFAWKIGLALSSLMFFLMVILNSYSIITGFTCLVCLVFLFFESSFGICLGCLFYGLFYKEGPLYCAGEQCEAIEKQEIQKTSLLQIVIIPCFIFYVILTIILFNNRFRETPRNLWKIVEAISVTSG